MGVEMLAGLPSAVFSYCHNSLPDLASIPTTALPRNCTYCLTPASSAMMTEEYAASLPSGKAHLQIASPVFLSSATIVASAPPGVHTSASPSTRGDSEYAHSPYAPPKSLLRFLAQRTLPESISRDTRSPSEPRA